VQSVLIKWLFQWPIIYNSLGDLSSIISIFFSGQSYIIPFHEDLCIFTNPAVCGCSCSCSSWHVEQTGVSLLSWWIVRLLHFPFQAPEHFYSVGTFRTEIAGFLREAHPDFIPQFQARSVCISPLIICNIDWGRQSIDGADDPSRWYSVWLRLKALGVEPTWSLEGPGQRNFDATERPCGTWRGSIAKAQINRLDLCKGSNNG
jgi:hypothetical protein